MLILNEAGISSLFAWHCIHWNILYSCTALSNLTDLDLNFLTKSQCWKVTFSWDYIILYYRAPVKDILWLLSTNGGGFGDGCSLELCLECVEPYRLSTRMESPKDRASTMINHCDSGFDKRCAVLYCCEPSMVLYNSFVLKPSLHEKPDFGSNY